MTENESRLAFEKWISAPPFEKDVSILGYDTAWPGNYRVYEVQLAWCAWQAAHESRAQAASVADGYAYSCADGFLRVNQDAPVNGGNPIDAIPFYFAPPPAQPASVPDGWVMVPREASDHLAFAVSQCWKRQAVMWKDIYRQMIAIIEREAPQPQAKGDDHGN